jgi:hypothetical protein
LSYIPSHGHDRIENERLLGISRPSLNKQVRDEIFKLTLSIIHEIKTNENSRKMQIRNHDDIMDILRSLDTDVDRIFEDHGSVESVINPN